MQRIVSVSVVGMKKLRHSVKYIIILKNISIIVFRIRNQNHDQGSFSFKKNTHGNKEWLKLIAKFHLNGRSLFYKKGIGKIHYILSFKKNLFVSYLTFFLHAYRNTYFSCRPKTKAKKKIYIFVIMCKFFSEDRYKYNKEIFSGNVFYLLFVLYFFPKSPFEPTVKVL